MKDTVPITLPPEPILPKARVISVGTDANIQIFEHVAELNDKLRPLVSLLSRQPEDMDARNEMLVLCSRMTERTNSLSHHPVGRLVTSLESLLRDLAHRTGAVEPGLLRTITQAVDLLAMLLTPEVLARSNNLPQPSILALDDDKDLLPAIAASLAASSGAVIPKPSSTSAGAAPREMARPATSRARASLE